VWGDGAPPHTDAVLDAVPRAPVWPRSRTSGGDQRRSSRSGWLYSSCPQPCQQAPPAAVFLIFIVVQLVQLFVGSLTG
jgi:hypothetical protein